MSHSVVKYIRTTDRQTGQHIKETLVEVLSNSLQRANTAQTV